MALANVQVGLANYVTVLQLSIFCRYPTYFLASDVRRRDTGALSSCSHQCEKFMLATEKLLAGRRATMSYTPTPRQIPLAISSPSHWQYEPFASKPTVIGGSLYVLSFYL